MSSNSRVEQRQTAHVELSSLHIWILQSGHSLYMRYECMSATPVKAGSLGGYKRISKAPLGSAYILPFIVQRSYTPQVIMIVELMRRMSSTSWKKYA